MVKIANRYMLSAACFFTMKSMKFMKKDFMVFMVFMVKSSYYLTDIIKFYWRFNFWPKIG